MSAHATTPRIATDRLVLRRPVGSDADAIVAGLADFEVARMLARVPQPFDRRDAEDWLGRIAEAGPEGGFHFAVTEGGPLLGVIGIEKRREPDLHLGYWLARPHWGRGLMSEAVGAAIGWYFSRAGGGRLLSGVFADNRASLRLQQKLGFVVTGRSDVFSRARNAMVTHIDTEITPDRLLMPTRRAA